MNNGISGAIMLGSVYLISANTSGYELYRVLDTDLNHPNRS
jgi:hypothetical protein